MFAFFRNCLAGTLIPKLLILLRSKLVAVSETRPSGNAYAVLLLAWGIVLASCKETQCSMDTIVNCRYKHFPTSSDSSTLEVNESSIFLLDSRGREVEAYNFWENGNVKQYGFFSAKERQAIFVAYYDKNCEIKRFEGYPFFVVNPAYAVDTFPQDTFEMYVEIAHICGYESYIEVFKNEPNDSSMKLASTKKITGNFLCFMELNLPDGNNEYLVVGTIKNEDKILVSDSLQFRFFH